jgi:hypothetical protein
MTMKRITILAVLTLNLTICLSAQAQLDPDPGGTGGGLWGTSDPAPTEDLSGDAGPPPNPGNDVPVDGGLSLLLAADAAYGSRRLLSGGRKTTVTKPDRQYP